jgi:hypothetical protein
MGYDGQHYSHSREFRSNIAAERKFWKRVMETSGFQGNEQEGLGMILKILVSLGVGISMPALCHLHAADRGEPVPAQSFTERLKAIYDRVPLTRTVYGRVVDQEGNGVGNADIELHWKSAGWLLGEPEEINKVRVESDMKGFWKATLKRPIDASIRLVQKEGYASIGIEGGRANNLIDIPTAEDNPVVAVLRKRGPLTFLIISGCDTVFQTDGTNNVSRPLDLLAWTSDFYGSWKFSATTNAELRIDAAFNETGKCWTVTYSVTNGPGGVILSDTMFCEAPADGYAPSVTATFSNRYDQRKYLYVRSRTPPCIRAFCLCMM